MNLEGLYRVTLSFLESTETSTAYIKDNKIYGGDDIYAFYGNCFVTPANKLTATLEVIKHGEGSSILDISTGIVTISAMILNDVTIFGKAIASPTQSVDFTLNKLEII